MGKGKGKGDKWFHNLQKNKYIQKGFRALSPSRFVENELIRLAKLNNNQKLFWKEFQQYLIDEREKRIGAIVSAITSTRKVDGCFEFGRIVTARYAQDPLNGAGSVILPPGGRFNFGRALTYSNYFIGLYFADTFDTAFAEKFHQSQQPDDEICNFALKEPDSFSYYKTKIKLDSYIDLTESETQQAFIEAIRDIHIPDYFKQNANNVGIDVSLVTTAQGLTRNLLDPEYSQWASWVDQPSPSQWFGHYVRLAKIQGILYSSVRNQAGRNLVVFPDNFVESKSIIELADEVPSVPDSRKYINSDNYHNFIHLT